MEIQVGEYIRTKSGYILKIEEKHVLFNMGNDDKEYIDMYDGTFAEEILKHSFYITDLIEKDDYVNGCRVYEVEERGITVYQKVENSDIDYNWISKDEIENVVTKEQFESIKYEV